MDGEPVAVLTVKVDRETAELLTELLAAVTLAFKLSPATSWFLEFRSNSFVFAAFPRISLVVVGRRSSPPSIFRAPTTSWVSPW